MAVRPLIRPRPRVIATAELDPETLAGLPRVLSRVSDCGNRGQQPITNGVVRQPLTVRHRAAQQAQVAKASIEQPTKSQPTLPAFWKSRKVLVAASILALVSAVAVGYQFRPKQQIIVVHPSKQPAAIATNPANNSQSPKPAFQPLSPVLPATTHSKETTSTASLMPRATWPAEKMAAPMPSKTATPPIQTAIKPSDTRTISISTPAAAPLTDNPPRMSSQFPQTPNPQSSSPSNSSVVYNPTMTPAASPLVMGATNPNNQPPQTGASPHTAARPNYPPPSGQGMPSSDGSFGAYGGASFDGQIQPLPLRR